MVPPIFTREDGLEGGVIAATQGTVRLPGHHFSQDELPIWPESGTAFITSTVKTVFGGSDGDLFH